MPKRCYVSCYFIVFDQNQNIFIAMYINIYKECVMGGGGATIVQILVSVHGHGANVNLVNLIFTCTKQEKAEMVKHWQLARGP